MCERVNVSLCVLARPTVWTRRIYFMYPTIVTTRMFVCFLS